MERMVEIERFEGEGSYEVTLRPSTWDEYIGQEKIKKNLRVFIEASKKRGEALDHILFFGPPGLGKHHLHTDGCQYQNHGSPYDRKGRRSCGIAYQY